MRKVLGIFALITLVGCQASVTSDSPESDTPLYYDVGVVQRAPVPESTCTATAPKWRAPTAACT